MRIIGGKYKGRIFNPGKQFKARPTTDIAREGLFNILANRYDLSDKNVLDLFSGTGSMGYEFISRGSKHTTLVEINFSHYRFIRETLSQLEIRNARLIKADVFQYLRRPTGTFDIIFADPPFDLQKFDQIPAAVFNSDALAPEGILILEHPREHDFSSFPFFNEKRNYGKVNFSFFSRSQPKDNIDN